MRLPRNPARLIPLLAPLALLIPTAAEAAPVVLARDTFDAPGATRLDDPGDALDLAYYALADAPAVQGGRLAVPTLPGGRFASSTFARTTVGLGESISLKFSLEGTSNPLSRFPVFCIGLYDSRGTPATDDSIGSILAAAEDRGYVLRLLHDPALFYSAAVQQDFTDLTLNGEDGFLPGPLPYLDSTVPHTFEMVFRPTAEALLIDLSYDGSAFTTLAFAPDTPTFDNLQFGFVDSSSPATLFLDDIQVTYHPVPEPGAFAMVLPGLAVLSRRRRGQAS